MTNEEIAAAFDELAERLAIVEQQPYRWLAYQRAAATIRSTPHSVEQLARSGTVQQLPGVGAAIAQKISDFVETGTFRALDRARTEVPDGLLQLTRVPGIGKSTALRIWGALDAREFDDVVAAAQSGSLQRIPGVGATLAAQVIDAAGTVDAASEELDDDIDAAGALLLRDQVDEIAGVVTALVTQVVGEDARVHVVGAYARGAELSDRVELLVACAQGPHETLGQLCDLLVAAGWTLRDEETGHDGAPLWLHSELVAPNRVVVGLFVAGEDGEARAYLHAVGPPEHADAVLGRAGEAGASPAAGDAPDAALYEAAGLAWVPLELRERPEALDPDGALPAPLVREQDFRAELHCHTRASDGRNSVIDMAHAAFARGDTHLAITDHSAPYAMVNGLDAARLADQADEIALANRDLGGGFTVLRGTELEVLPDGRLGLDDETLATLDWVVASMHVMQRQTREEMTARVERAMRNPYVDCIAHPTGRVLLRRQPSAIDTDRLVELALETGTILEINASPRRLDMSAELARRALEAGVLIAVNSDAHGKDTLDVRRHGIPVARRAGATPAQVVNCWPWEQLRDRQKRWRA